MSISQYSDDELLEEVKHRGFKIETECFISDNDHFTTAVIIGGMRFELTS